MKLDQKERELWLILAGALLTRTKSVRADAFNSLEVTDACDGDLIGLLAGIEKEDTEQVWDHLKSLGVVPSEEKDTTLRELIKTLKSRAAHRVARDVASRMRFEGPQTPSQFVAFVEQQIKRVKDKL